MSENERREELIAAAATGDLTAAERDELDAMCALDPTLRREIDELTAVAERISSADWVEPSARRAPRDSPRVRRSVLVAASVALLAGVGLGVGGTILLDDGDRDGRQATAVELGPPGTLGAHEPLTLAGADEVSGPESDAEIDGVLVAHTWGTEAILDVVGLPPGEAYEVVFLDAAGTPISAGAFLGSEVPIHCAMNAAVLREDVATLRIVNEQGTVVRSADLPAVAG